MEAHRLFRSAFLLFVLAAASWSPGASAQGFPCVEGDSDKTFCGSPRPAPFNSFNSCDEGSPNLVKDAVWCSVKGGSNPNGGCPGATPFTEGNLVPRSVQFAEGWVGGGGCTVTTDSGWESNHGSNWCNTGDEYSNGVLKTTSRRLVVTCGNGAHAFTLRKSRPVECPVGYSQANHPATGALMCARTIEDCENCGVGNPITPGTGVKVQAETDYRHALGLEFKRHYHSFQFYEPFSFTNPPTNVHTETRLGAVWRSNFDRRVMPVFSNTKSRAMSLPSGEVQ